ncbi:MAG: DEAD/DEAH box helicase family protein [Candidatus Thermoplasmatota archaeon]|nr:DEAD/DEAH box helicase family protein [Candidatus Thermoplasmatota archaeon]
MKLTYYKGTILLKGDYSIPNTKWDVRSGCHRSQALYYRDIIEYLEKSGISYEDSVLDLIPCPDLSCKATLRDYQKRALEQWMLQRKGVVVMPTGSGKTVLALKIIEHVNSPAFIVVPTLDLVRQWKEELQTFDIEIGEHTGEKKDLQAITVSTYDSAYINAENLGNRFKLLIFDEVHHLPGEGYRQIAEMFASPFRLGLTATYEREDGLHEEIPRLIGGKVYEIQTDDLTGEYLSNYETKKILVELTKDEQKEYKQYHKMFRNYIVSRHITMRTPNDFKKIIMRSGYDSKARDALLARNKAERIAYNSKGKIDKIQELLSKDDRIIIFTRYNDMVYEISKRFFIPCITYRTDSHEREAVFNKFKSGEYSVLVSSQVLDEGIDVPEANVGIIVSGTGSSREYIQRLGRLLRPRENKKAVLYELVTKGTKETRTSYRRKK